MRPTDGLSIIIPSRGDVSMLWATITACEVLLDGVPHEFIVVLNGQEASEIHNLLEERSEVRLLPFTLVITPPIARNIGAKSAKYDTLCFLDDHVIPTQSFFSWDIDAEVVHCSYKTYPRHELRYFHYKFNPECPVKGDYATSPLPSVPNEELLMDSSNVDVARSAFLSVMNSTLELEPYPCLSGPHGGFFVDRKYFLDSNGYDDFWQGFGGEEAYFGLKANLRGARVVCNPNALFYHFSCREGVRGYSKEFNEYNFTEGLKRLGDTTELLQKFQHHKL